MEKETPATGMSCDSKHKAGPGAKGDGTGLWVAWREEPTQGWTSPANATETRGPGQGARERKVSERNVVFLLSNIKDTLLILYPDYIY